ncbi:hypothetical protein PSHT_14604 [Puccinia striiformis]|uniref:Uncharacterized protein n=1 Tax=Puccinia striiformis TaxID=27350 RepID=A0A2S4UJM3_9BASI|nr:hypothetical protein PSHT_14604 [Puccinia striiformis]
MSPDKRVWLAEHRLQPVVPCNPEDQIDTDDPIDTPEAYSDANLDDTSDAHMSASSANFPSGAMFPPPDSTLAKSKLRDYVLATPSQLEEALLAEDPYQYWSKDIGAIFKRWSFADCPKYNGTVKMDVRSWLKKMEMFLAIHLAHPVIWSQFGLLMLTGRAVRDMEVLHSSKKTITTWEEFSAWITSANPLSVSKRVVALTWLVVGE